MAIVLAVRPHGLLGEPADGAADDAARRAARAGRRPPGARSAAIGACVALAFVVAAAAVGDEYALRPRDRHPDRRAVRREPAVPDGPRRHGVVRPRGVLRPRRLRRRARGQARLADGGRARARAGRPRVAGALVFGWFCVRLSGVYLAMLTLAFAQIVWSIAFQWDAVTGGSNGLVGVWPPAWLADRAPTTCSRWRSSRSRSSRSRGSRTRRSATRCAARATRRCAPRRSASTCAATQWARVRARRRVRRARRRAVRVLEGQHLAGDAGDSALGRRAGDGAARRPQRARRPAARRGGVHVAARTRSRARPNTGARRSGALILAIVLVVPARASAARSRALRRRGGGRMSAPVLAVERPRQGVRRRARGATASRSTSAAGELVALIGPNGAGKTTCFNLINGQLVPDAGRVALAGSDVTGRPPRASRWRGVGPHVPGRGDVRVDDRARERRSWRWRRTPARPARSPARARALRRRGRRAARARRRSATSPTGTRDARLRRCEARRARARARRRAAAAADGRADRRAWRRAIAAR